MQSTNFENYHSLKLIEALTSIIEKRDITTEELEYLKHTLTFIPWNNEISDAWIELLSMINRYLGQLVDLQDQQKDLREFLLEFDNSQQRFEILENLVQNEFHNNNFQQAMQYVNQQLDIAEINGNEELISRAYRTKGVIYQVLGQFEEAENWYLEAYKLVDNLDDERQKDQILYSLANLYQHYLAKFKEAKRLYEEAYELSIESEDQEKQVFYLDHIAMAEYEMENYKAAIDSHDQAWMILRTQPDNINVLFHKVQLSMALAKLGDYERVGKELASIIKLKKNNDDPYSNCWYLLLLSEYCVEQPNNYHKYSKQFAEQLALVMDPLALAKEAHKVSIHTNHIPSQVNSKLYIAKYLIDKNEKKAKQYLNEAKQLANEHNRQREIDHVKKWTQNTNLDN